MSEPKYGVQMLKVGEGDIPGPELFWMSGWDEWFQLDFMVGLIRGNGITALVNTGPASDLDPMNEKWEKVLGKIQPDVILYNASISAGSCEKSAIIRNSICE